MKAVVVHFSLMRVRHTYSYTYKQFFLLNNLASSALSASLATDELPAKINKIKWLTLYTSK